ncbi:MAG TPA: hypothetical protein VMF06_21540 [Candidatus Limnocylindria bacterium]|jgi:hypothetical protein|nr:hypothetical protein [Candidatus Limnocylindria bacterium]
MNDDDLFEQTGDTFLCMIHPIMRDALHRQELSRLVAIEPLVTPSAVVALILGASWRERLLGLGLAMIKGGAAYVAPMIQSLRDPRGIAIVPACAALAVLGRSGIAIYPALLHQEFDHVVFDGEIAWAMEQMRRHIAAVFPVCSDPGRNSGQHFDDHIEVFRWLAGELNG